MEEATYGIEPLGNDKYDVIKKQSERTTQLAELKGFLGRRLHECVILYGTPELNAESKRLKKQPEEWMYEHHQTPFENSDMEVFMSASLTGQSRNSELIAKMLESHDPDNSNCWGFVNYLLNSDCRNLWNMGMRRIDLIGEFRRDVNEVVKDGGLPIVAAFTDIIAAVDFDHAISGSFELAEPEENIPKLNVNGRVLTPIVDNIHESVVIAMDGNKPVIADKRGDGGICKIELLEKSPYSSLTMLFDFEKLVEDLKLPRVLLERALRIIKGGDYGTMTAKDIRELFGSEDMPYPSDDFLNNYAISHKQPMFMTPAEHQPPDQEVELKGLVSKVFRGKD